MVSDEALMEEARRRVKARIGFWMHLAAYILVNLMFIATWWFGGMGFPWFIFMLAGWGIGIVAHYIETFHGESYIQEKTREEYRRLKEGR